MAKLKIPETEMSALVSKQILDGLSEETQHKLISDAISFLVTKQANDRYTYGAGKTPLQTAFEEAMRTTAREIATEVLNRPENRERIVAEYTTFIEAIPSFADDWDLQVAFMRAIIEHAKKLKDGDE